ncbi:MAG TPA: diadenylate cyclase, partial [Gaiellaceae bacterium]|nr:diadenylate cyclase [Gaiellaceae bacterium]
MPILRPSRPSRASSTASWMTSSSVRRRSARACALSRPLLLDPLYGHPRDVLHIALPEFRETVKELAQLDGAFVVHGDGTFAAAARYVEVASATQLTPGLGTRHAAAASITAETE